MAFTPEQRDALAAPLPKAHVKHRSQAGRSLSYVEAWKVIEEANRIFGFDAWTRETIDLRVVSERERQIGAAKRDGWSVSYIAKVRITVFAGDTIVTREGVGAGHGIDVDLGQAHESAAKEAESDAMKRGLMTFGNPFGLALYDKEQANVADEAPATSCVSTSPASTADKVKALLAQFDACKTVGAITECWVRVKPSFTELTDAEYQTVRDYASKLKATFEQGKAA
jgi:DNA recombination protein Rad52